MTKVILDKENKVLKIIDIVAFFVALACFVFCFIFSLVGHIAHFESPINGYGEYTPFEVFERAGMVLLILVPWGLRKSGVILPRPVTTAYYCFMLLTSFGGTFMGLYINTKWWDKFNHTLSGVLLGFAGLFFLNSLVKKDEKVGAFNTFLYVFSFAIMCGAVWEIYEFTCDGILGLNMQKFRNDHTLVQYVGRAALADTMGDIIVDAIGGAIAGTISAVAVSRNRNFLNAFKVVVIRREKAAEEVFAGEEVAATTTESGNFEQHCPNSSENENE